MTKPIPLGLLARIQAHERWAETFREEGQQFVLREGD